MTRFRGWEAEALEFFEGLQEENAKAYWERNKDVYVGLVRAPMEALLTELQPDWGEGKIFRPYRDVRFSKDKSPYKTAIGARVGEDGYVQLSAAGLAAGAGMWEMAPDQLARYRQAVVDEDAGEEFERVVSSVREAGLSLMGHDELKTAPRGYPKDHPRIELLRYKGLVTWNEWPPAPWLGTRRAKDRVVTFFERSRPVVRWLREHVGDSTASTASHRT